MISIEPQTTVRLCSVPLEEDNLNVLSFSSRTNQHNYFEGKTKYTLRGLTYTRDGSYVVVEQPYDQLIANGINYLTYINIVNNKEYFCYITSIEYINENATRLNIKTDVFSTWQFDIQYKPVYIEREHTNDDTIGSNIIPENFQLSEGQIQASRTWEMRSTAAETLSGYYICFLTTEFIGTGAIGVQTRVYDGIYTGLYMFACKSEGDADGIISAYQAAGKGDAIIAVFYATPKLFADATALAFSSTITVLLPPTRGSATQIESDLWVERISQLDGYNPKNNKLLTYPYCWVYASNNAGQNVIYRPEDLSYDNEGLTYFDVYGSITQGCKIRMIPRSYKGSTKLDALYDYGISCAQLPILAWASDYYLNYMAQNGMNIAVRTTMGVANAIGGMVASNLGKSSVDVGSFITSGLSIADTILTTMAEQDRVSKIPDQAEGNTNFGDLAASLRVNGFVLTNMTIKAEFARYIDGYFSMFGYKTNQIKIPNVTGRQNWNYVKTIGANMDGNIPQADLQTLRAMFDRGVTIWHNPNTIYDYGQNNGII